MVSMVAGALALLVAGAPARAGTLYVNGVRADGLKDFTFENVDVRVDNKGNIWVDAPHYKVEVEDTSRASAPTGAAAPVGTWWLVTEDHGSTGHNVDVIVNGTLVQNVRSGQPQVIVDLGPYLRRGNNSVILNTIGGNEGSGGVLNIYVGSGSNRAGTVVLDKLEISATRRAQDAARSESRTYQLDVP